MPSWDEPVVTEKDVTEESIARSRILSPADSARMRSPRPMASIASLRSATRSVMSALGSVPEMLPSVAVLEMEMLYGVPEPGPPIVLTFSESRTCHSVGHAECLVNRGARNVTRPNRTARRIRISWRGCTSWCGNILGTVTG